MDIQTTFSWGLPHTSPDHAGHLSGSSSPVQVDFQIRNPDGSVRDSVGVSIPPGQMKLTDYGFSSRSK